MPVSVSSIHVRCAGAPFSCESLEEATITDIEIPKPRNVRQQVKSSVLYALCNIVDFVADVLSLLLPIIAAVWIYSLENIDFESEQTTQFLPGRIGHKRRQAIITLRGPAD